MQLFEFMSHLSGVRKGANGYTAQCPAHEDKKNSLGISQSEDGHILLKCYAGCEFESIVRALGLEPSDLMPEKKGQSQNETVYKIDLPQGGVVEHVRIDEPGGKRFIWRRDGESGLGGLKVKDVPLYRPAGQGKSRALFITEGEKSAIAAARLGCRTLGTVCGASSCPSKDVLAVCKDEDVILWADNDEPGQKHMEKVKTALNGIAKSVCIISTGKTKDDAADFKGTLNDIKALIDKAKGVKPINLIGDFAGAAINSLARYCNNDYSDRIPTGFSKLDDDLRGGFMRQALYLIGAPSGMGKTTLLQCMAVHAARTRGPVLFVSPEMSGAELAEREAIRRAGVSINEIAPWKNPNFRIPKLSELEKAAEQIQKEKIPVYIIDDSDITMSDIKETASRISQLSLVIIDYAQEIANRDSQMARYLAVGDVGKESIVLGKSLDVPVVVASQVNVVKENNALSYAFRETKDLEHRAHCSMIMEVTRSKTPNRNGYYDVESTRLFARKNRSGAIFSIELDYEPALFSIKNKEEMKAYIREPQECFEHF